MGEIILRMYCHLSKGNPKETWDMLPERSAPKELGRASLGSRVTGDSQDSKEDLNSAM